MIQTMLSFAKKYIVTGIIILIILIIGAYPAHNLFTRLSFSNSKVCWVGGLDQKSTFPKDKLIQSFYPEKDGLRAIIVKPLLENDIYDTAEASFTFKNGQDETVFSRNVSHFAMEHYKMFELLVPPDLFRKGELYYLEISPLVEKKPGHNLLGFWITDGNCYEGNLRLDEKKIGGTDLAITFRYSNGDLSANLKTLFERIAQYKPLWLKDNLVLPILFSLFILGTLFLVILLARKIKYDD